VDPGSTPGGGITEAITEHEETVGQEKRKVRNEGNQGEALAVKQTPGAVGYAGLADAIAVGFGPYAEEGTHTTIYWDKVQSSQETAAFAEPEKEGAVKNSNCPEEVKLNEKQISEAKEGNWSNVFLENLSPPKSTSYPLCTIMYDVGWKSYKGLKSATEKYAEGVGNTISQYLAFAVGAGQEDLADLASYDALPKSIDEIAKGDAGNIAE
jgi:ABC-type phosphate transport system substrate-binding protein